MTTIKYYQLDMSIAAIEIVMRNNWIRFGSIVVIQLI